MKSMEAIVGFWRRIKGNLLQNIAALIVILGAMITIVSYGFKVNANTRAVEDMPELTVQLAKIATIVDQNRESLQQLNTVSKQLAVVEKQVDGLCNQVNSILISEGISSLFFIDCANENDYVQHASPEWSVTESGTAILNQLPGLVNKMDYIISQTTMDNFSFDSVLFSLYKEYPNQELLQLSLKVDATLEELLGISLVYMQEQIRNKI